jgi:uncharacterized protein involved in exopolysaccharide biosynthesis
VDGRNDDPLQRCRCGGSGEFFLSPLIVMHTEIHEPVRTVTLFDVAGLVRTLWPYWLGGALIGCVVAGTAAFSVRPVYRAATIVVPVSLQDSGGTLARLAGQFGGLASLAGLSGMQSDGRDEAIAVLKSQSFSEKFIVDENLLPVLFAGKWDSVKGSWKVRDSGKVPTLWDAWVLFDKRIRTVIEDKDRGLVTVRIDWHDPREAARWANLLVDRANQQVRERKLAEIDANLDYLKGELAKVQLVELRQAIGKVMESQVSERMIASGREEYAFRRLDPARAPDLDRPQSPQKALWIVLGTAGGTLLGFALGTLRAYARQRRDEFEAR